MVRFEKVRSSVGGSGVLDEEAHLGLYRKAKNVAVGLYIHCSTVSFAYQCVGVSLINKA